VQQQSVQKLSKHLHDLAFNRTICTTRKVLLNRRWYWQNTIN